MSVCFYKTFFFSGKHLKTVKLSFTIIFHKLFFAFQVFKTFLCFLAFILACFQKFIKLLLLACALFCFSLNVRPEKFQFLEKEPNRNFDYDIVISVKNP